MGSSKRRIGQRKMGSSKQAVENVREVSVHRFALQESLYNALNLGRVSHEDGKWRCKDIDIQKHVVRATAAFLDSFPGDASQSRLIMDAIPGMTEALAWILQCRNEAVIGKAASVAVKLIAVIPKSMKPLYALDFLHPLSCLVNFHQVEASISAAMALNMILTDMETQEEKLSTVLKNVKTVDDIVSGLCDMPVNAVPIDYFYNMASLLSTWLLLWPPARYRVYHNSTFMKTLKDLGSKCDNRIRLGVLKLYSVSALCVYGAGKLLEAGKPLLEMMICSMDESWSYNTRREAFKLAECLVADEKKCMTVISICCEPLVNAIIGGMGARNSSQPVKSQNEHVPLLMEACHLALIVRWSGDHHHLFWKFGITTVLLNLLLEDIESLLFNGFLSIEEQISIAQKILDAKFLPKLRPYVWDILGWLAVNGREDMKFSNLGNELHFNLLITCACLAFWDSVQKGHSISQDSLNKISDREAASRVALFLIHSPCKYIATKARDILSEILKPSANQDVKLLLRFLHLTSRGKDFRQPTLLQSSNCLIGLTCLLGMEQYWRLICNNYGMKILVSFFKWCLSKQARVGRQNLSTHLHNPLDKRLCCKAVVTEDWNDKDVLLHYSLLALEELVISSFSLSAHLEQFICKLKLEGTMTMLQEVRDGVYATGPKMHAMRILSYFGQYGFQTNLGRRFGEALREDKFGDLQLVLAHGYSLNVHKVFLVARSPSLLPPSGLSPGEKSTVMLKDGGENKPEEKLPKVRLSSHVEYDALLKVLEFVYTGYVEIDEQQLKKLMSLTKICKMQSFLRILCRKRPRWGLSLPTVDLSLALGPLGSQFMDIVLEAKELEFNGWKCGLCPLAQPHLHAHKVILWSSCDYLRGMLGSGMQESHSDTLKIPIGFRALSILVNWLYTGNISSPPFGCKWENMSLEEKLEELIPYMEIYWLSEYWMLAGVPDVCRELIEARLDSDCELCLKILPVAIDLGLLDFAEIATENVATAYHKLREAGALEGLEESLSEMLRSASVRVTLERGD